MKTLVIHPEDYTTDFLKEIYKGIECTLISSWMVSKNDIKQAILSHDRIILLGHGDKYGLFGHNRYIIDSQLVYLLREKENVIYVWCNADEFCNKYQLKGFKTGMIISDYSEALLFSINASDKVIEESNTMFASSLKTAISGPTSGIVENMKSTYSAEENPIINFNKKNLHYF